jgi:hypothetical protein
MMQLRQGTSSLPELQSKDRRTAPDRFRESRETAYEPHPAFLHDVSETTAVLSWRKELTDLCADASRFAKTVGVYSLRDMLAAKGLPTRGTEAEKRARLGADAAVRALGRVARKEVRGGAQAAEVRVQGDLTCLQCGRALASISKKNPESSAQQEALSYLRCPSRLPRRTPALSRRSAP